MKKLVRRIKSSAAAWIRKVWLPKPDYRCRTERFGGEYGGWELAVDDLSERAVVYSVGVGEDASFDTALIDRFGVTIHAFDPTPKSIEWVSRQNLPGKFVLHRYGVADFDGEAAFNPPENPNHVSHTMLARPPTMDQAIRVPVKKVASITVELGHTQIDVLKMDIEGAEYAVIRDLIRSSVRPKQLLIEFHDRFPNVGLRQTIGAIRSLRKIGYRLFSVSPRGEEFGFILV